MKSFRTKGGLLARVTVGATFLALTAWAQAAVEKGTAKVVSVQGTVEVSTDGTQWKSLKKGVTLREGAMVRTAGTSAADLDLGRNGSHLRVMPGSSVVLSALSLEQTGVETLVNTVVDLKEGRVLGHAPKMSAASKCEVRTEKAVASVQGTRYDISADGKVVVAEGSVVVVSQAEDGTLMTRVVHANEMFSVVMGQVSPAGDNELADIGGSASSIPGIVALPALQSPLLDDRTSIDRAILPTDVWVSRTSPQDVPSSSPGDE
jgi:hypothetical protein